jgi:hypothetical protein
MNNTVYATGPDYTILGSAAYRFVKAHRDIVERVRQGQTENAYFVFEADGIMRAAQTTLEGAERYMTGDRVLVTTDANG